MHAAPRWPEGTGMLSVAERAGEVLAVIVVVGSLVVALAAAGVWWLRRRLRRLLADHARALLAGAGLPASAEVIARPRLLLASSRRALARAVWRAITGRASSSGQIPPDRGRQDASLPAAR